MMGHKYTTLSTMLSDVYSASLPNVLYLGVISGTIYKTIIVPSRTFCVVCYHVLDFDC